MKLIFSLFTILFFSIWNQILIAQQGRNFITEFKSSKSIHQIELEKYSNYKIEENLPKFVGKPMPLIEKLASPSAWRKT